MKTVKNSKLLRINGFTLIETAVVMLILGLVLGGLITAIGQSTENNRRADAQALINRVEEALYGFAQSNGRLPCPATNTSGGLEAPAGGGICTVAHGFVPAATMGLQGRVNADGLLLDPWSNPLRYSVSTLLSGGNRAFTSVLGMQDLFATPANLVAGPTLLRVCNAVACTPLPARELANTVPAVIISMGANWNAFAGADEVSNAGNTTIGTYRITNTNTFVSREYNDTNFDDIISWISPHILFSRLVTAGQLP
ncbi:MAG: prepilin-type N-terminal cleavage/methylation domain-containing protein [Pseudohongiella sp.]|nr:prepilin-type N-terminal cleavage/methylation domain-containing protein [Pseudohongiella sp.]